MSSSDVIADGIFQRGLPKMRADMEREQTQADEFLARADAKGLRNIVATAHKRNRELVVVLNGVMELYSDKPINMNPSHHETPEAIDAMRQVALAAIDLANRAFGQPEDDTTKG